MNDAREGVRLATWQLIDHARNVLYLDKCEESSAVVLSGNDGSTKIEGFSGIEVPCPSSQPSRRLFGVLIWTVRWRSLVSCLFLDRWMGDVSIPLVDLKFLDPMVIVYPWSHLKSSLFLFYFVSFIHLHTKPSNFSFTVAVDCMFGESLCLKLPSNSFFSLICKFASSLPVVFCFSLCFT